MPSLLRDDDIVLNYQEYGSPDAPAILLLHRLGGELRDWHEHAQALSLDYRVVAIDLRGHGLSTSPPELGTLSADSYRDDVIALLAELGLEACGLVGVGFGALVALAVATTVPDRIAALALADVVPSDGASIANGLMGSATEPLIARHIDVAQKYGSRTVGRRLALGFHDEFLGRGVARRWANRSSDGITSGWRLLTHGFDAGAPLAERLTMPVMVLVPDAGEVADESRIEFPTVRFITLSQRDDDDVTGAVQDFIDDLLAFFHDVEDGAPIV